MDKFRVLILWLITTIYTIWVVFCIAMEINELIMDAHWFAIKALAEYVFERQLQRKSLQISSDVPYVIQYS